MAIAAGVSAHELGQTFAEAVRSEPQVSELWVSTRRDGIHLWLISEPVATADERRLHGLAGMLYERFPEGDFEVHVLNPRRYARDVHEAIPAGADKVQF